MLCSGHFLLTVRRDTKVWLELRGRPLVEGSTVNSKSDKKQISQTKSMSILSQKVPRSRKSPPPRLSCHKYEIDRVRPNTRTIFKFHASDVSRALVLYFGLR